MKKPTREQMIKRLKTMKDSKIDYSDIPPLDMRFMKLVEKNMPKKKETITLRLDPDIIVWLKSRGKGYQTQVNAVLRSYMEIAY